MKQKKYFKFREKVLRALLFIGVLPLVVVSVISLLTVINTRLENISELQDQAITAAEEKVNRYLEQKIGVFNLVIDLNPDNISEIATDKLMFLAEGLIGATSDINEISFIDKYGKEIIKESSTQGTEIVALKNIKSENSFKTAIKGENYFGPVYYTMSGPIVHMASQIENKNRQIIGVILAEINLTSLEQEIGQTRLGKDGFIYLLDAQGGLMISSNKLFAHQGQDLSHIPLIKDAIEGNQHNGLNKEDRYKNSLDEGVVFSGRKMETVGWLLASEWPWKDAFSATWLMLRKFLIIIVISLALVTLFSMFFSGLVVKPIELLSKGADEISKGNFDYNINIKTGDELEKLGEKFKHMKKVLKDNQKLRDEFVFVAAHELRAPVTAIKGYVSMILEGDYGRLTPEMKKTLETTKGLNERLVRLVHDLLEVARSEAGRMEVKLTPVSILENINTVLKEYAGMAKEKNITMSYNKSKKDIKVMADPYKLKEVITNILSNAIKYTTQKGTIQVSHETKGNFLITHIKDQGIGISKQSLKKLFSKFYRVKTEKTKGIEGTGLGLFICKEIIERMGGKIWVTSEEGKGSKFSFSLKIAS